MRIILLLLFYYILYRMLSRVLPPLMRRFFKKASPKAPGQTGGPVYNMVSCAACGSYVSQSVALAQDGKYYCSEHCRLDS